MMTQKSSLPNPSFGRNVIKGSNKPNIFDKFLQLKNAYCTGQQRGSSRFPPSMTSGSKVRYLALRLALCNRLIWLKFQT